MPLNPFQAAVQLVPEPDPPEGLTNQLAASAGNESPTTKAMPKITLIHLCPKVAASGSVGGIERPDVLSSIRFITYCPAEAYMSGFWPGATAAAEHNQDLAPVMPNNPNPVKDRFWTDSLHRDRLYVTRKY